MHSFHRNGKLFVSFALTLTALGCASPGPPRAPSLNLPEPVRDLSATRIGDTVELHFTAPSRTTDKLPPRAPTLTGQLCRQLDHQPCIPVPSSKTTIADAPRTPITWTDTLPPDLAQGPQKPLTYRVEFFSPAGRSAGPSNSALTAAGAAPPPVDELQAQGSRLGTVLTWAASSQPGDVLIKREDLAPTSHKPSSPHAKAPAATVWLGTPPNSARTLDTTALPDTPYRYTGQRRSTVHLGDRSIELLSALSDPIPFTLHEVYPPLAPTGLTAVGFYAKPPLPDVAPPFAVDLIWQPVDEPSLSTPLTGYNVYREAIDPTTDPRDKLNPAVLPSPAFHDTTADPSQRYRYSVTAVDAKGNESPAATVILEPHANH